MRKARMAQALKDREGSVAGLSNAQMLKEIEMVAAVEKFAGFDVWAKAIDNLGEFYYVPVKN